MARQWKLKHFLQRPRVLKSLAWLGSWVLRFIYITIGWRVEGEAIPQAFIQDKKPFILCFWHGRLMMLPFSRRWALSMLISSHRDGQLIAAIVRHFGIHTIAGSSSRDATSAFRAILNTLKRGQVVGITPDGPRGPAMTIKDGVLKAAYLAQVPIIPLTFSTSRGRFLGSWDKFLLARPFGRGIMVWGDPLYPPSREVSFDAQAFAQALQMAMEKVTTQADKAMGHTL